MLRLAWISVMLLMAMNHICDAGSPCPPADKIYPCFCTVMNDAYTMISCAGIRNKTQLEQAAKPFKSMIVDRLMLLNTYTTKSIDDDLETNFVDTDDLDSYSWILPKKWLSVVRVRELEVQGGHLHNCFLCDDALEGQADFLTSLVVKNANLSGHLCSTCSRGSAGYSLSTRELRRTPLLKTVDFSYNAIEQVDGSAFPSNLRMLKKIDLSNNKISRINDVAFANLHQLTELDLSRNQITSISRKIFRSDETVLKVLDLSHNMIRSLPDDTFVRLAGLTEVKLSHNLIEVLAEKVWTQLPINLQKVDLRGNFLVCNCTLRWISRLGRSTKVAAQCSSPAEVEFHDLKPTLSTLASCR